MPSCSICALPTLAVVDRALVLGAETISELARRNGVSRQALLRHRAQHLPKQLVEAHAEDTPDRAALMLAELEALRSQVGGFIVAAQAKGDVRGAVTAIREATRLLELLAKMQGTLQPPPSVVINVLDTVEFRSVASRIIGALEDEPSAREKVSAALRLVH